MIPSIEHLTKRFDHFNRTIFAGRLPKIRILLADAKGFIGQFRSRSRSVAGELKELIDCELRFSRLYDVDPEMLDDTVIHEMIHYFIAWSGQNDTAPHGILFKAMLVTINANHHRNLKISHRGHTEGVELTKSAEDRRHWHVIAVIHLADGRKAIKVLPRIAARIIYFHNTVLSHPGFTAIDLYLHDNPYFHRYPNSAALKYHLLPETEIRENLSGAKRLKIQGRRVVQVTK